MKKLLSISLSFLLLLASSGFIYSSHYCFGRKVKSMFTQSKEALSCFMNVKEKDTKSCNTESFRNKSCCSNEYVSVETDSDFNGTDVHLNLDQTVFVTLFCCSYQALFSSTENGGLSHFKSPPPLVKQDYQSLYQVYII